VVAITVASDPRLAFLIELIPKPMALAEALQHQAQRKAELGENVQATGLDDAEIGDGDGDSESTGHATPPAQGNTFETVQLDDRTDGTEADEGMIPDVSELDYTNRTNI